MKQILLYTFLFTTLVLVSCNDSAPDDPVIEDPVISVSSFAELLHVLDSLEAEDRPDIVGAYLDTLTFTPVFETTTDVYFVYFSESATSVSVTGDFSFWSQGKDLTQVEGTGLWYTKMEFESNARLDYKFITNGSNWILDPKNPNKVSGGFGPNSELAMPDYEQPWEIKKIEGTPAGTMEEFAISSTNTSKTYTVHVYLPAGYDSSVDYPAVYFQDGGEYQSLASAPIVLDNLIQAGVIEPVIGVFVTPTNRNDEYAGSSRFKYCDFYVKELVPYIDSNYSTDAQASRRAVLGDSYGGNISAIISFNNPEVFGNCGLHSGAFQEYNYETNDLVTGPKQNIRVASIWGSYEGSLTPNMREIKDHLVSEDYDIIWKELPEGHSWGLWRATLDDMLVFFFPK